MTHEDDTVFRLLLRQIAEEAKNRTEPVNALEQANHEAHRDKPLGLDLTITRFLNAYVFDQEIEASTHDPEVGTEVKEELCFPETIRSCSKAIVIIHCWFDFFRAGWAWLAASVSQWAISKES